MQVRQEGGEDIPVWKVVFTQTQEEVFISEKSYWNLCRYFTDEQYRNNKSITVSLASPTGWDFKPIKMFLIHQEISPDGSIDITLED